MANVVECTRRPGALLLAALLASCSSSTSNAKPGEPMAGTVRVVYLHHSTGGNVWGGGVPEFIQGWNQAHGTSYAITEVAYPNDPYPWNNYPYDYWNLWVEHSGSDRAQGQATLEDLTASYDVIVWKHCYPVSDIQAGAGAGDERSEAKTLPNYRAQYARLLEKMRAFPSKRFIVWTGAALVQAATSSEDAARAVEFARWVKEDWDVPGDNVFVWDFRQLETGGGLYLLPANAASASDSHPNATFSARAAPLVGKRIVDVIEGRGDTGSLTGE